ncbi:S8 family serine peptidase [Fibrella arboris]|uniref:S8 family serine peptidase n=1 Tax=Fibrella arboris TaxID=3242486 RepID=UPI00352253D0
MARLDPELHSLLHQYRQQSQAQTRPLDADTAESVVPGASMLVQIYVQFTGTPDALEAAGMEIANVVGPVAYGQATLAALDRIDQLDTTASITKLRRKNLFLNDSIPDIRANQVWTRTGDAFTNGGQGVIVGIIDTGIEYRSHNFRSHPDHKTRLLSVWDQTLAAGTGEATPRSPITIPLGADPTHPARPVSLNYGVEYTGEQINAYLANGSATPEIRHEDEDGHGSHVSGIAGGSGIQRGRCHGPYTYIGVAPAAELIVVRLWGLTKGDDEKPRPTGAGSTMVDAIIYILNEAKKHSKPVVINLSLGSYSAELTGENGESKSVDALLKANTTGAAIVFAAGNDANSKFHARATVPAGPTASLSLKFKIGKDDKQRRQMTLRYTGDNLRVRLSSEETSTPTPWVISTDPTKTFTDTVNGSGGSVQITSFPNQIEIALIPPTKGTNRKGDWTLELQSTTPVATLFDAFWLYGSWHNEVPPPYFLDHTNTQSTLSTEGATREAITVGAYTAGTDELADFSGRGVALGPGQKPEITAPGVSVVSTDSGDYRGCCNWLCCRCCFYKNLDGTSMAAPHVAGAAALLFQKNKALTHVQVKDSLINKARAVATTVVDDQLGWGKGKLDVKASYDFAPAPTPPPPGPTPPPTPFMAPPPSQIELLQRRVVRSPHWPHLEVLLDRYGREISTLVNTNKRVATVWHRCGGPAWVRVALQLIDMPTMAIPATAGGHSLDEGIDRMQAILQRYGSAGLVSDLQRFSPVLALVESGRSLLQLVNLLEQTEPTILVTTAEATL